MFRIIDHLHGSGQAYIEGRHLGSIDYQIKVVDEGFGLKAAGGHIMGDGKILKIIFDASSASLELADGRKITIMITTLNPDHASAEINVSGAILIA